MIDRIVRKSYGEYWIIYSNKPAVVVRSSGSAYALLEYLLVGRIW